MLNKCWICWRKFRPKKGGGLHFTEKLIQGSIRKVHKSCAELWDEAEMSEIELESFWEDWDDDNWLYPNEKDN